MDLTYLVQYVGSVPRRGGGMIPKPPHAEEQKL